MYDSRWYSCLHLLPVMNVNSVMCYILHQFHIDESMQVKASTQSSDGSINRKKTEPETDIAQLVLVLCRQCTYASI